MEWKDYGEIANALNELYPNRNPVVMENAELIEKITALPGFKGDKQPPNKDYLSFISYKWIMVRSGETTPYSPPPI